MSNGCSTFRKEVYNEAKNANVRNKTSENCEENELLHFNFNLKKSCSSLSISLQDAIYYLLFI
jgi:hypothetical protein